MRLAYVVGTFSAHPAVMGAMYEFLTWATEADTEARYEEMNQRCAGWVLSTNRRLADGELPIRVVRAWNDLDGLVQAAGPLQLAAPVLPA